MRALVTPKPGRFVLVPGTDRRLPQEGMEVEWNTHWERRMVDGDVDVKFLNQPEAATKGSATPKAKGEA